MRLFTCTDFTGHWPVGTAAIVLAADEDAARELLRALLAESGLGRQNENEPLKLTEIDINTANAIILNDGNY
jgi:hypothetical protein